MESSYGSDRCLSNKPLRLRAILEFLEGDLSGPPVVFPQCGSDEVDARVTEEILKRWAGRKEGP
jgi:hypothetical protein